MEKRNEVSSTRFPDEPSLIIPFIFSMFRGENSMEMSHLRQETATSPSFRSVTFRPCWADKGNPAHCSPYLLSNKENG